MTAHIFSLNLIEAFLAQKRLAMVGISREPKNISIALYEELCRRGYDVIPVNPKTPIINDRRCFARVQDTQPPVKAALLLTSPVVTDPVVAACYAAGVTQVWMYRAGGTGALSTSALEFCAATGIHVIAGTCPAF